MRFCSFRGPWKCPYIVNIVTLPDDRAYESDKGHTMGGVGRSLVTHTPHPQLLPHSPLSPLSPGSLSPSLCRGPGSGAV